MNITVESTELAELRTQLAASQAAQLAAETALRECQAQAAAMREHIAKEEFARAEIFSSCGFKPEESRRRAEKMVEKHFGDAGRELLAEVERLRSAANVS